MTIKVLIVFITQTRGGGANTNYFVIFDRGQANY